MVPLLLLRVCCIPWETGPGRPCTVLGADLGGGLWAGGRCGTGEDGGAVMPCLLQGVGRGQAHGVPARCADGQAPAAAARPAHDPRGEARCGRLGECLAGARVALLLAQSHMLAALCHAGGGRDWHLPHAVAAALRLPWSLHHLHEPHRLRRAGRGAAAEGVRR
jgi:hypothetical protein